jgi:hypothetical protein
LEICFFFATLLDPYEPLGYPIHCIQKYNSLVERVAETSMVVAILLPHVLYVTGFGMARYFLPSFIGYIVTETILLQVISFWIPFLKTVVIIVKWQHGVNGLVLDENTRDKFHSKHHKSSLIKNVKEREEEIKIVHSISHLLMYWIALSVLSAFFQTLRLLPILGGFLPSPQEVTNVINSRSRFRLSHRFCEEIRLFFFLWLFILNGEHESRLENPSVKSPKSRLLQTSDSVRNLRSKMSRYDKSPVGIVYDRLKPVLLSITQNMNMIVSSVSSVGHEPSDDRFSTSIPHRFIKFVASVFDFLIFTKVMSQKMKLSIMNTLAQCVGLLPALPTLFMPSYFTKFGIIYVSYIVPAANATRAKESMWKPSQTLEEKDLILFTFISSSVRFLQYWVLHSMISAFLSYFTPILSWVPLFYHAKLLVFSGLQLEYVTQTLYGLFTEEMIFFGFIKSPADDYNRRSIILRLASAISGRLGTALAKKTAADPLEDER